MSRQARTGRWAVLAVLVLIGMLVVAVWGEDLRAEVHAFLRGVVRGL